MWNDRPALKPIVGELDHYEEMDVCLSVKELRSLCPDASSMEADELLSGRYLVEPWFRVRFTDDWVICMGVAASVDDDGA